MNESSDDRSAAFRHERLQHRGVYQRVVAEREEEFVVEQLRPRCGLTLEVGVGSGRLTRHLRLLADRLIACDLSETLLDQARQRIGDDGDVEFRVAALDDLPALPEFGRFDTVVALRVVPLVENWREALDQLVAAVRPGGRLLVDLWRRHSFVAWVLRAAGHLDPVPVHRLAAAEIEQALRALPVRRRASLAWGYPRLGPLEADRWWSLVWPQGAYSTVYCLEKTTS